MELLQEVERRNTQAQAEAREEARKTREDDRREDSRIAEQETPRYPRKRLLYSLEFQSVACLRQGSRSGPQFYCPRTGLSQLWYSHSRSRPSRPERNRRTMKNLSDLLRGGGIDPRQVLVLRHTPAEHKLKDDFRRLTAEQPDVFNAYQQTQTSRVEKQMMGAGYVASFIGHEPGKALFVGLYSNNGSKPITRKEYRQIPAARELLAYGHDGFPES